MDARQYLQDIGTTVQDVFIQNRMLLSFQEYVDAFYKEPRLFARSSAQYLRDAFDFYGTTEITEPTGAQRRFKLFDCAFDGGEGRVAGHEPVQNALYRIIGNFVRAGRVNKLVMLHGPNGSAKTSIISAMQRALEDYSRKPEGAMYRFNWIFPSEKLVKGSIGFGERAGAAPTAVKNDLETYAHLDSETIDARIPCEMRDHPLFLIPRGERLKLLQAYCGPIDRDKAHEEDFVLSDTILEGELCAKCRQIYSSLLGSFNGDYLKVVRHIQVERFYVSRRYVVGATTVEPQVAVDADYRQLTADKSHGNLPPPLQNLTLWEPYGPLVAGNRGIVEFSDLLKRPLEAFKYLLGTSENATVSMGPFAMHLDAVLISTSNEKHLSAFKEMPDFASFKGRIELVRAPYLRRASVEQQIYDGQVTRAAVGKHIAPHATWVAANWALLTRLKKPIPGRYKGEVREVVDDLSPLEKLRIYDTGDPPDRLALPQARELKKHLFDLFHETDADPNYEGRAGASAREIKTVIFNAAQNPDYRCLTPLAVLEELDDLVQDKTVYEFLQQEALDGFHDHEEFVRLVESVYLDRIDDEIRDSMGLIGEQQYKDLFERYIQHSSHWVRNERIQNRLTGEYDRPDEELMATVEEIIMTGEEDRKDFRRSMISSIGAHKLENPDAEIMEYRRVFPDAFRRLRDHFFDERRKVLKRNKENVLRFIEGDSTLSSKETATVQQMLRTMIDKYAYCENCARDAILFLMRKRYAD